MNQKPELNVLVLVFNLYYTKEDLPSFLRIIF